MKKKNRKKGFTLIELLAVIVIIVIIAIVAVPIVLNLVKTSRKNSHKNSIYNLVKAVKYYYVMDYNNDNPNDLIFTFGDYSDNSFMGETGSSDDNQNDNVNNDDYVKYITINNPINSIEGLIKTNNKKISDLIDNRYYDESIFDNYEEFEKEMVDEIQSEIDDLKSTNLEEIEFNEEDELDENIRISEEEAVSDIIKDELLVSGRHPDYGYIRIDKGNRNKVDLKLIYDEFCYIKDAEEENIRISTELSDCDITVIEHEYTDEPQINFTIDNEDQITNVDGWYRHNLKIILTGTSQKDDSVDYIKYCKTTESSCDPDKDGKKINNAKYTVDISDAGSNTICAYVATNNGIISETECSQVYQIDRINPTSGKMTVSGERLLSTSDWYTSEVYIEKTEDGVDEESGLYSTLVSEDYLDVSTLGTLVKLETSDVAGNITNVYAKVKIDMEKPTIYGVDNDLVVQVGKNADFDKGIIVVDGLSGGLGYTLSMNDTSSLEIGDYEVIYTAYDEAGNSEKFSRNLSIVDEEEYKVYEEEFEPDVCIGDNCECNGGDCECYGSKCNQSETAPHKTQAPVDKYTVTIEPNTAKSTLEKQNNWINRAFDLKIKAESTDGTKIKNIYYCISISDGYDATNCSPLEYFDGSKKSPYKAGSKTLSKIVRMSLSKDPKQRKLIGNGSEKVCTYVVGADGTRSNVYCSYLFNFDNEKPTTPEIGVNGEKVIRTSSSGKITEYYTEGSVALINKWPSDNATPTSELQLAITPKAAQTTLQTSGYELTKNQTIRVKVTDKAGNYASVSKIIKVDKSKPSTPTRKAYKLYSNKRIYSNNKSDEPIRIELSNSTSNIGARVDHYEVSTDKVNWQQIATGYVIYESGKYYFRAVDEFGQASRENTFIANITIPLEDENDNTVVAPVITIEPEDYSASKNVSISYDATYEKYLKVNGSNSAVTNNDLVLCVTNKDLTLTCDQNIVAGTKLTDGTWYKIAGNASITVYDNYTSIVAKVVNADNFEKTVSKQVKTIETTPTAPSIKGGSSTWQKEAIITLNNASSATSGIAFYEYCASDTDNSDNCTWTKLDSTELKYSVAGEHYIFFRAESNIGLKSEVSNSEFVKIDNVLPVVTITDGSDIAYMNLSDPHSELHSYCISTENNIDKCLETQNSSYDNTTTNTWIYLSGTSQDISFTASSGGIFYLFVKDKAGNVFDKAFKIVYSGITARAYNVGEELNYAGLSWKVITDNGDNVTLILNGYYKSGAYGSSTTWSSSTAKKIVNEDFVNAYPLLKDEIEFGGVLYDSSSASYVRIPTRSEINTSIAMSAQYPFWTMTNSSSEMYVSGYNGETYRNVAEITDRTALYQDYTYTDTSSYLQGDEEYYVKYSVITGCSGTRKELMTASPNSTSIVVSSTCGSASKEYYSTDVNVTTSVKKPSFYYCHATSGRTKVDDSAVDSSKWTYANGSTSYCTQYTVYSPVSTSKSIVYRPVITVKKRSDKTEIPILTNKTYAAGNTVDYANLKWKVISDNGANVTLILDGNYKTGAFGSSVTWSSSTAKNVVNTQFVNDNVLLKNAIDNGYIVYNSTSGTYVRLPFSSEISTAIPSSSNLPFWTMSIYETNKIYYSMAGGSLERPIASVSRTSYYKDYDWLYYDSDYDATAAKNLVSTEIITSCSNSTTPSASSPTTTYAYTLINCGKSKSVNYYSTSAVITSRASSSSLNFEYCDSVYGEIHYSEDGGSSGSSERWPHASTSSSYCAKRSEYQHYFMQAPISYRPVITVMKGEI